MTDFMEKYGHLHSIRCIGVDPNRSLSAHEACQLNGTLPASLTGMQDNDRVQACAYTLTGNEDEIDFIHRHFTGSGEDFHGEKRIVGGRPAIDLIRHTFRNGMPGEAAPITITITLKRLSKAITPKILPYCVIPFTEQIANHQFKVGCAIDF